MITENDDIFNIHFEWPIVAWPEVVVHCEEQTEEDGGYTTQGSEDEVEYEEDLVSIDSE